MAKAYMIANNPNTQTFTTPGTVNLGTALHGFGKCNCQYIISIANGGISLIDDGYYDFKIAANVSDSAAGNITMTVYQDGVPTPFTLSTNIAAANDPGCITLIGGVTVPQRKTSTLTVAISASAGDVIVNNIATTVTKE